MEKDKHHLTVCKAYHANQTEVPELRLKGKWLADYGFTPGVPVTVSCCEGSLIITKHE